MSSSKRPSWQGDAVTIAFIVGTAAFALWLVLQAVLFGIWVITRPGTIGGAILVATGTKEILPPGSAWWILRIVPYEVCLVCALWAGAGPSVVAILGVAALDFYYRTETAARYRALAWAPWVILVADQTVIFSRFAGAVADLSPGRIDGFKLWLEGLVLLSFSFLIATVTSFMNIHKHDNWLIGFERG